MAKYVGYAAAGVVFFEMMHLAHKYHAESSVADCSTLLNALGHILPFFKCNPTFSVSFLWRVNAVTVVSHVITNIFVIIASALGTSMGTFVNSFFAELGWLIFIPSIFISLFVVLFSVMAIFRYELSIFGFLSLRPSSIPIQQPPPAYSKTDKTEVHPGSFHRVKEFYQRLAP